MTHKHFCGQILKTGFPLENRISQALKDAGWKVISNKYYVDDTEESVREIDLIAYQVGKACDVNVFTVLIISCKKNESNAWVLLARAIDPNDPNADWLPLHAWSNDRALAFQLNAADCARRYHEGMQTLGAADAVALPAVDVFAFQEMNKTTGAPQNDKNIFNAATSLMKAQAYELGALAQRKTSPCIYQFNLVSIVDAELVRLIFDNDTIDATEIESEHYIARYIIRKRETFSRIRFMRPDAFITALPGYRSLHQANCRWFASEHEAFYQNIVKDHKRTNVLLDQFRKRVEWPIKRTFLREHLSLPPAEEIELLWNAKEGKLKVSGPFGAAGVKMLNDDEQTRTAVSSIITSLYRYDGPIEFEEDIPF